MKFGAVFHLGVVVGDLEKAVRIYEEELGYGPFEYGDGSFFDDAIVNGVQGAGLPMRSAIYRTEEFEIELIEPTGPGVYMDHLQKKGPGIHHVMLKSDASYKDVVGMAQRVSGRPPRLEIKFPDGTPVDYNVIFDIIDRAQNAGEIRHKELKRFMNQFRDADRTNSIIWNRYDEVTRYHSESESQFIRNPTLRVMAEEANNEESGQIEPMLESSELESFRAWHAVAGIISLLEKENQKLVMAAHYLCGADWNRISRVYEHQDRWAVQLCRDAFNILAGLELGVSCSDDPDDAEAEIERLTRKWETDEAAYESKLAEAKKNVAAERKNPNEPIDDLKMVLGLL